MSGTGVDPELGLRARTVPMSALQEQPGESKDSYVEGGGSGTSGSVDVCTPLVGAVEPAIVTGRTPAKADRTPRTRAASVPSSNDDGVVAGLDFAPLARCWLKYSMALVLRNGPSVEVSKVVLDSSDMHAQIVEMLHRALLEVAFLRCVDDASDEERVVVLISAARRTKPGRAGTLLEREHRKQFVERFLAEGHSGSVLPPKVSERQLTTAKKLQLTHRIVMRALQAVTRVMNSRVTQDIASKCRGKHTGELIDVGTPEHTAWDFVEACFPLHDAEWSSYFVGLYMSSLVNWKRWGHGVAELKNMVKRTLRSPMKAAQVVARTVTPWEQAKAKAAAGLDGDEAVAAAAQPKAREPYSGEKLRVVDADDWAVQHLREHMGERVAFYFAFLNHYTAALAPVAIIMLLFYVIARFAHWPSYMRGLSVLGCLVPIVWAPLMVRFWLRRQATLHHDWGLMHVLDDELPNPDAEYKLRIKDAHKAETERVFDPHKHRHKALLLIVPFVFLNGLLICVTVMPFVQWYIFGRMAPLCSCCEWHRSAGTVGAGNATAFGLPAECTYLIPEIETAAVPASCRYFVNCFDMRATTVGSDRWAYIFLQGAVLGILLDVVQMELFKAITAALTRWEHWPTMSLLEKHLIRKQFLFCWVNMYFWFFAVAFMYVPFGRLIQDYLVQLGLGWAVPHYGWQQGSVNLDEAFVTPLVVTQAVNLVLETFVPYLCLKIGKHTVKIRKPVKNAAGTIGRSWAWASNATEGGKMSSVSTLGRSGSVRASKVHSDRSLMRVSTKGRAGLFSSSEKMLSRVRLKLKTPRGSVKVLEATPDANKYIYSDVLYQARLPEFHPRDDFLDIFMQFGYVCMFTVCWALAPITALVNNVLELRFDCFKLFFTHRRAVPAEDPDIGEWQAVLQLTIKLALPVVAGLVVVGTGQLEFWMFGSCQSRYYTTLQAFMDPDFDCFESWGVRLMVAVLIERIGHLVYKFVNVRVSDVGPELKVLLELEQKERVRAIQDGLLPTLPNDLCRNLQIIFTYFDKDDNGILGREELMQVLHLLKRGAEVQQQHVLLFLSFVDVDDSNTVSFAEFALALKRAQDDFVLKEVLAVDNLAHEAETLAQAIRADTMSELIHMRSSKFHDLVDHRKAD